jgi:hypothetical protein
MKILNFSIKILKRETDIKTDILFKFNIKIVKIPELCAVFCASHKIRHVYFFFPTKIRHI